MSTDIKNQDAAATNAGEGEAQETLTVSKADWDNLNSTIGALKRDLKAAQKPKEEAKKETPQQTNNEPSQDFSWGEKAFLKASGIKGADELQLVRDFAKRTGLDVDAVLEDDIFQGRLDKLRTTKSNEEAASGGSNRGSTGSAKNTPEYWLAKLGPNDQVPADLPRELRTQIVQLRRTAAKSGKMFYND